MSSFQNVKTINDNVKLNTSNSGDQFLKDVREDKNNKNDFSSQHHKDNYALNKIETTNETEQHMNMDMEKEIRKNSICNYIGNGNFDYIEDKNERNMLANAWKAISLTNNWEFMTRKIDAFMFSEEPKIAEISNKMEELGYTNHSGSSFGYTMRLMQYLVKNGEENFKNIYLQNSHKSTDEIEYKKFFEYSGGF